MPGYSMRENFINHKRFNYVKSEWGEMLRTPKDKSKGFYAETEGGVFYNENELNIYRRQCFTISKEVNLIKEVIGGEIVQCEFHSK